MFDSYLDRWDLTPDGEEVRTDSSLLLPVLSGGRPAMLKIAIHEEERRGNRLMALLGGERWAAPVLACDDAAILLQRATSEDGLAALTNSGRDDEACRIGCSVVAGLHLRDGEVPDWLVPLDNWFSDLISAPETLADIGTACAEVASRLLAKPEPAVVLHGDIHHGNILDFGDAGWRAIDPKGLRGARGFDYANFICNPDGVTATDTVLFDRRIGLISELAGLPPRNLLRWVAAWCGLSAIWSLRSGNDATAARAIGGIALGRLRP